jgi:hypothetical protein
MNIVFCIVNMGSVFDFTTFISIVIVEICSIKVNTKHEYTVDPFANLCKFTVT